MKNRIVIIDYGSGNLNSVSKALEKVGAKVTISSEAGEIRRAGSIVLPGVGSFRDAVTNLDKLRIKDAVADCIRNSVPFFGICLGMQLLFSKSEEGNCGGLDIFRGKINKFKVNKKIPHMGWNQVKLNKHNNGLKIFKGIPDNSYFYFAHSYHTVPADKNLIAGTTAYGKDFVSMIHSENVYATQFHPEKSGAFGLKILYNFCKLTQD